jgi:pyruvate formate lyase activating enzyme
MTGIVFDIKEMTVHDGPGLRTTVFLKGCPLRCRWCHNPEGLSPRPQLMVKTATCTHCGLCRRGCNHPDCQEFGRCLHICPNGLITVSGKVMEAEELAKKLMRCAPLFGEEGGITFSGGEPLMQADFMLDVMDHMPGIRFACETSGYAPQETFRRVVDRMSLIYMDLKLADPERHKEYTGVGNERILENARRIAESGVELIIRTPVVPGFNDTPEEIKAISHFAKTLPGVREHHLLPYHRLGSDKYDGLGRKYSLKEIEPPSKEKMEYLLSVAETSGLKCKIGG